MHLVEVARYFIDVRQGASLSGPPPPLPEPFPSFYSNHSPPHQSFPQTRPPLPHLITLHHTNPLWTFSPASDHSLPHLEAHRLWIQNLVEFDQRPRIFIFWPSSQFRVEIFKISLNKNFKNYILYNFASNGISRRVNSLEGNLIKHFCLHISLWVETWFLCSKNYQNIQLKMLKYASNMQYNTLRYEKIWSKRLQNFMY